MKLYTDISVYNFANKVYLGLSSSLIAWEVVSYRRSANAGILLRECV